MPRVEQANKQGSRSLANHRDSQVTVRAHHRRVMVNHHRDSSKEDTDSKAKAAMDNSSSLVSTVNHHNNPVSMVSRKDTAKRLHSSTEDSKQLPSQRLAAVPMVVQVAQSSVII